MPPRPRPRAVNRPASNASSSTQSASQPSSAPAAKSARERELDNDDQLFMRNRSRTAQDWKRLETIEKGLFRSMRSQLFLSNACLVSAEEIKNAAAEVSSSESEGSTPRKKRKAHRDRKGKKTQNSLPEWTRQSSVTILSSDSDDDLEVLDGPPTSQRHDSIEASRKSNKRQRSRSRSLTPPPKLTMQQLQNARNVVRQTLEPTPRAPSPGNFSFDDSTDTIVLDPEFASIASAVKKQSQRSFEGGQNSHKSDANNDRGGGPETVTIRVKWRPHPLHTGEKPEVFPFTMKRHENFHRLLSEIADEKNMLDYNIVLTYERSRVVAGATPHSLKVWAEAEMEASTKTTFEYIRENPQHNQPTTLSHVNGTSQSHNTRAPSLQPGGGDSDESDSDVQSQDDTEDETFKLVLRSAETKNKNITLTVRPTTTCGAIVKAFLKRAGLAEKYPEGKSARRKSGAGVGPRLVVDGDKLDPETPISEADLDDGDQVEVVGL
ncbi:uncharacterized protein STEHIDRAFT_157519 [Stereum hirsutum FP-91666 SS1]|uniref:uncharacterized protein n=1 Tax=Stereum hirsutum (strain FP-91666) TaxID=721885 RepID=UPI0004449348|nr:uncharacterized protein STEHIDRAFT_157519 [Stereum hirsutum FP-91666 SS1]EIM85993.1 hypothetical protein STEHIDRAFT_157519 [Stereum hirsutum FP-91666 SS1]